MGAGSGYDGHGCRLCSPPSLQLHPTKNRICLCRDVVKAVAAADLVREYSKSSKQYPAYKPFQVHDVAFHDLNSLLVL